MSAAYQHLALSDVKPGMILSDDIVGPQGQVLLPKGAILSAATIALLPGHGVESLAVLRPPGDGVAQETPDDGAIEARLAKLFRKSRGEEDGCATHLLRRYIGDFRLCRELAP